jgi:RNA polymerase sigma-70 factor (ECF subfamily)
MNQLPNNKLVLEQCKMGNHKAQMQVYNQYADAMFHVANRIVKDSMLAEDVMQEGFLKAFTKMEQYSGAVSFGAWLKKIIVNQALNELRKNTAVDFSEDVENHSEEKSDENDISGFDSQEDGIRKIKHSMNRLPDRYKIILNLQWFEGYDLEEVSEILDLSYTNARVLSSRAKTKLKSILTEEVNYG